MHVLGLVVAVTISGHNRIVCLTRLEQDTRVFRIPSFRWSSYSYLKTSPCLCPLFCLCQFFQIFLENLSLLINLFFSPIALIDDHVCVCVCVCVCACVRACVRALVMYTLNFENMCNQTMCKRLGPVWVGRSKCLLLLLKMFVAQATRIQK